MSNINLIVTNPNDVHRILKDFGTYRFENKKDHLVENDNRKKRCRDHDVNGYNNVEDDSTDVVYRKKYKTPINRRSDYLVQDDDPPRKIVSQRQKTITLEEFLEERNKLVMRLDKNSKKRLLETTHPPPSFQSHNQSTMSYPYHPSIQFYRPNYDMMPNAGVPTPYNMYGGSSQYSQIATVHHQNDVNANTNTNANTKANCTNTGHLTNSTTANTTKPSQDKQSRQLELQLPDDSRSPQREVLGSSPSTTQQHQLRQQQQKKKQQQYQQQYQQQQQPYTRSQHQVRPECQKSTNGDVSSPELFRGLIDEIGDIDEV